MGAIFNQNVYAKLVEVARRADIILYSELAPTAGLSTTNPHFASLMAEVLDEINLFELKAGRPLLSAVVVAKETGMPGAGFFNLPRKLGLQSQGDLEFWALELKRVHAQWAPARQSTKR
jgi:hypothetical protein